MDTVTRITHGRIMCGRGISSDDIISFEFDAGRALTKGGRDQIIQFLECEVFARVQCTRPIRRPSF